MNIKYKLIICTTLIFTIISLNFSYSLDKTPEYIYGINNLLLIGVNSDDKNEKTPCYSATVLTINSIDKSLKLTTLCVDTLVDIPSIGNGSLRDSYLYGREKLLVNTIESNFNINIDNYVVINKTALVKIVNSIGGIKISNSNLSGEDTLKLLLKYGKSNVFIQEEVQRNVIQAMLYSFSRLPFISYPGVIAYTFPYVKVNITPYKMLSLGFTALSLTNYKAKQLQFPPSEYSVYENISSRTYINWDKKVCIPILNDFIYKN
jgi:polyisoprenyl-teichoic acid--peptidoglycan teichoic acid transferase